MPQYSVFVDLDMFIKWSYAKTLQVLDPRTRLVLFRLLQRGMLSNLHGCISTGKEANVYHATDENGSLAVKIYKTSILTFKDRERYVAGEYRCVLSNSRCTSKQSGVFVYVGVQVPHWLLQAQPAKDGRRLGGEGDAQPHAYASSWLASPQTNSPEGLCHYD